MTTAPDGSPRTADLADKTRAYLTAHGWARGEGGEAGALWTAPDGQQVAVGHWLREDEPMFSFLVLKVAHIECRQAPVVAAEIIDPDAEAPVYTFARAWTWTRVERTDVEILADTEVRLCARKAVTAEPTPTAFEDYLERSGLWSRMDGDRYASLSAAFAAGAASEAARARARHLRMLNVTPDRHCGHCGRGNATASAYETPLCHTDDPGLPDCYRRVTVYGEPVGALLGGGPKPAGVEAISRPLRP